MRINEFINQGVEKHGAQEFYDIINNYWEDYDYEVKNAILDDIYRKIKPSKIETIDDLARLLDGNDNGDELSNKYNLDVEDICRKNKWVICFPYSDDNIEFRGFIDDELGAWDGGFYKFYKEGDFYEDEDQDNTYHKAEDNMVVAISERSEYDLKAAWCNDKIYDNGKKYIWDYTIENNELPHAYFNIIDEDSDEDEIWAKCCIIDLSSLYE